MADAVEQGADTIITQGATQSNHARQTAAIATKLNMDCIVLLEDRTASHDPDYKFNGNVMLDQLFNAHLSKYPGGNRYERCDGRCGSDTACSRQEALHRTGGGSNHIGALGYVDCALEYT
eukprot:TRINITY_DN23829_c0_g1_i1.p1 TRINITY_DN23829_c0_g1~~TRINITY_DN23829_c0_g1_i1.p1  ORF type:complete len:120 (-),score=4.08 TRINITY_DN23829_c0_g1_i1:185-544(-)